MSRRRRQKKKADLKGKLFLGVGVVLIIVLGFSAYQMNQKVIKRDSTSMCRVDNKIARETALVIDATDSFSNSQALLVKKELESLLENALTDERFTLYVLGKEIDDNPDRFTVCNPGDGRDKSELTSNKRRLRQKWEELFFGRIVDAVDELTGEHHSNQSPILEMMKLVSIKSMYKSKAEEKRIVIISDMLQHTRRYSHYKTTPDFFNFNATPYSIEQKPQLSDVDVEILYLIRGKDILRQNRGHISFWEQHVSTAGGLITRVKTIN